MEGQNYQKDFFTPWIEFQKNFFSQWANVSGNLFSQGFDPLKQWQESFKPYTGSNLFTKWNEMVRNTLEKAMEHTEGGVGPDVFSRVLRAGNVFVIINQFWMDVLLKDLPEVYRAKGDPEKSGEIFERWQKRYKDVFEQIIGTPVSDSAEEMMQSWLNIVQMYQATMGTMLGPWFQATPQWQGYAEKFMKGDLSALAQARSLWREVYDETLGKVLQMPAFGLTKDHIERQRKTYDAFVQYLASIPNFYQLFFDTGKEALKEVFEKIQSLTHEEMKPETIREIYQTWWISNENAFFELFKKPEFGEGMADVLNRGLRLKQRLDNLTAEWCKAVSIPTYQDFDEVAGAVQELRRRIRNHEKTIDTLQQELDRIAAERS